METVTRINRGRSWLACGLCYDPSPGYGVQSASLVSRVDAVPSDEVGSGKDDGGLPRVSQQVNR